MIRQDDVYKIGRLGKPHGIHGELSLQFSDDVFDRTDADYLILDVDGILVPFYIDEYRFRSNETALITFCDINSQEKVRRFTGCDVYFPRHLSDSNEQNISWAELIGYALTDEITDREIGIIRSVDDSTINILFEAEDEQGKNHLIPASTDLITGIDSQRKEIRINLPEGILDLNESK